MRAYKIVALGLFAISTTANATSGNPLADLQNAGKVLKAGKYKLSYDMTQTDTAGKTTMGTMKMSTKGSKSYFKMTGLTANTGGGAYIIEGTANHWSKPVSKVPVGATVRRLVKIEGLVGLQTRPRFRRLLAFEGPDAIVQSCAQERELVPLSETTFGARRLWAGRHDPMARMAIARRGGTRQP